jgi:hypothetical protein
MKQSLILAVFAVLLSFEAKGKPMTNLGPKGNQIIAAEFAAYMARFPKGQCGGKTENRRAIVSGFGLFSGITYNITSVVLRSFAGTSDLEFVKVKPLKIGDEIIDVCFVSTNVRWDLAGAILAYETSHFQPELVLMTGRSGATFGAIEAGALNSATGSSGFNGLGEPLVSIENPNMPESEWIIPELAPGEEVRMLWDSESIGQRIRPLISKLGYDLLTPPGARLENTYICNNLSMILLHYAAGNSLSLAGGEINLPKPSFSKQPIAGFFHYPQVDADHPILPAKQLAGWRQVITEILSEALSLR